MQAGGGVFVGVSPGQWAVGSGGRSDSLVCAVLVLERFTIEVQTGRRASQGEKVAGNGRMRGTPPRAVRHLSRVSAGLRVLRHACEDVSAAPERGRAIGPRCRLQPCSVRGATLKAEWACHTSGERLPGCHAHAQSERVTHAGGCLTPTRARLLCASGARGFPLRNNQRRIESVGPRVTVSCSGQSLVGESRLIACEYRPGRAPRPTLRSFERAKHP